MVPAADAALAPGQGQAGGAGGVEILRVAGYAIGAEQGFADRGRARRLDPDFFSAGFFVEAFAIALLQIERVDADIATVGGDRLEVGGGFGEGAARPLV